MSGIQIFQIKLLLIRFAVVALQLYVNVDHCNNHNDGCAKRHLLLLRNNAAKKMALYVLWIFREQMFHQLT